MSQSQISFEPGPEDESAPRRPSTPNSAPVSADEPKSDRGSELAIALGASTDLSLEARCRIGLRLDVFAATRRTDELAAAAGISRDQARRALELRGQARTIARAVQIRARGAGVRILTLDDPDYPEAFRDLELPPPSLYVHGSIPRGPAVALVGSREADPYGLEVARLFAGGLARAGVTVVSGFARGIDGEAHRAALNAPGGRTLAILGCGVDVSYPAAHRSLARRIPKAGALLSEFPCGVSPTPRHFPFRNRLIAAFGLAVLVVQAARRSGSLITARLALDLGRDVFAIPGRIFDPRCEGANALIRDGGHPVQHPDEILELLGLPSAAAPSESETADSRAEDPAVTASPLLAALDPGEPRSAEDIARRLGRPVQEVLGELLEEEILGRVRRLPGPTFHRAASL